MAIEIGLKGRDETVVCDSNTAAAVGSGMVPVFATPFMIALMEGAAAKTVLPYIAEDEGTVGTHLNVSHSAATPIGMKVWAEATVTAVEGKKITFDVAAFTNLTQDHLDFHGDMEQYYQAKAILFDRCRVGVVNRDDAYGHRLVQERPGKGMLTCSVLEDEATLTAKNVLLKPDRVQFEAVCGSDIARVRLGIPGHFSVYNALTVIGCALCLGLDLEEIAAGLACAEGVLGRAEVVPTDTDYTVVIDYAHTPDSMEKILRATRPGTPGRLIALFGAGGDRDATKRPIMGRVGAELADICVITSDNPRSEDPQSIIDQVMEGAKGQKAQLYMVPDRREAIAFAMGMAKAGDTLLLLGKGHETYQEIGGVQLHLDEREEVARILKEQKK
jgi:UDP-N-acetylmuramoyl-L-alanyl-D-glutamate--2,6-diaminopimelate ligase